MMVGERDWGVIRSRTTLFQAGATACEVAVMDRNVRAMRNVIRCLDMCWEILRALDIQVTTA